MAEVLLRVHPRARPDQPPNPRPGKRTPVDQAWLEQLRQARNVPGLPQVAPPRPAATATTEPGDVVAVCANRWPWTVRELTNPEWAIAVLEGLAEAQLRDMTRPLVDTTSGTLLLLRGVALDPESGIFNFLRLRAPGRIVLSTRQRQEFLQARRAKPAPGRIVLQ